jgi:transcriptional regulator with XRE-family HTH domain
MNEQLHDTDAQTTEHDTLGATLRAARQARGMSIQELAAQSGVSVGMISQLERGRANPSMRLLTALRRALNISMQELFGESGDMHNGPTYEPDFVRRAADRPVIDLGNLRKELLTSGGRQNLQIMLLKIEPGGHSGGNALAYPAEKGGLVLSGEVALSVNGREAILRAGDSFTFDSAQPHSIRNDRLAHAEVIWIIGAVRFDRHL